MLRDILGQTPLLLVPLTVLLLFLGVFVGALIQAYGGRKGAFDAIARLPNDDDTAPEKRS